MHTRVPGYCTLPGTWYAICDAFQHFNSDLDLTVRIFVSSCYFYRVRLLPSRQLSHCPKFYKSRDFFPHTFPNRKHKRTR